MLESKNATRKGQNKNNKHNQRLNRKMYSERTREKTYGNRMRKFSVSKIVREKRINIVESIASNRAKKVFILGPKAAITINSDSTHVCTIKVGSNIA